MKKKPFENLRSYLFYHKQNCQIKLPYVDCTCGRDDALFDLKVIDDMVKFLIHLDSYLDRHDSIASNSLAHGELDELLARIL